MANFQPLRKISNLWHSNSLVQWSAGVPAPENLIAVPICLNPGDAGEAQEFYNGRFNFGGELRNTNGSSPFNETSASAYWIAEIHSFNWMRHYHKTDSPVAKTNAQTLVRDWIENFGKETTGIAWTTEVIANRVISWLTHAALIIENVDQDFYANFLQSITVQTRYLILSENSSPPGMPQLLAKSAIAFTSLCLQGQNKAAQKKHIVQAANALGQELAKQFYADGGHVSRNPDAGINAALVLLPLHKLYLQQQEEPPVQLTNTLDRILPMLEFFAHPDGSITHFNGGGRIDNALLAAILTAGGHPGKPPENAAISGYQKLQAKNTTLVIDTGCSPEQKHSHSAHAGCLSFEISSGHNLVITNCGAPVLHEFELSQAARSTAAHSTATVNDTSSCRTEKNYKPLSPDVALIAPPFASGITRVPVARSTNDHGEQVVASHDGYIKPFGLTHQRTIFLDKSGETINGIDNFICDNEAANGGPPKTVTVRFHLHPEIEVEQADDSLSVKLNTGNGGTWKFTCVDARIGIEESVYFQPGYTHSKQILLSTPIDGSTEIRWVFEKSHNAKSSIDRKSSLSSASTSGDLLGIMAKS